MVKILLVEDNEMKRDMLSRWLKRKGYEVFIAVDGQEGVIHGDFRIYFRDPLGYESPHYGRLGSGAQFKSKYGYQRHPYSKAFRSCDYFGSR